MPFTGTVCDLDLQVAGKALVPLGEISLLEDLFRGSSLRFVIEAGTAPLPRIGDEVVLKASPSGGERAAGLECHLWCIDVQVTDTGRSATAAVLAVDPLAFCSRGVQFLSYGGRVPLHSLVADVLSRQPLRPTNAPAPGGPSPTLAQEWLLQCQESGLEFLHRVANGAGQLVYWNRDQFAFGAVGQGPAREAPGSTLEFGNGLLKARFELLPDYEPQALMWVDPTTRTSRRLTFQGSSAEGAGTPLSRRIGSAQPPIPAAQGGVEMWYAGGKVCEAETEIAGIVLGSSVTLPRGTTLMAESIDHRIHGQGSYTNTIRCVTPSRWGLRVVGASRSLGGPFQGCVSHNDDPLGQGRVRVVLSEDAQQRPSHWLPVVPPAAGSQTGWHWVPDIGDLVVLVNDPECPENLYCLGAIRGQDQRIKPTWRSSQNSRKVLAGKDGLEIVIDEQQGSISILTRQASLELTNDGTLRARGIRLDIEMDAEASVKARQRVAIDAARVDLCP